MTPTHFPHHIIPLILYSIDMNATTIIGQHTLNNSIYLHNNRSCLCNKLKEQTNVHLGNIKAIKPWTIIHLLQPQKIIKYQIKTIWFKLIPIITLKQLPLLQAPNSNHMVCHTLLPDHYNLVHTIVVAFSQEEWAVEISMWSRLHISPGFPPEKVPHGTSVCPSPHQQISSQHPSNWTDFFMSTEKRRHTALTSQYNRDHSLSIQSWVVYWQYW